MKKIYRYIIDFIELDFELKTYSLALITMLLAIYFNYFSDFKAEYFTAEDRYSKLFFQSYQLYIGYFIFYGIPFLTILLPKLIIAKEYQILKNWKLWIYVFLGLVVLSLDGGFYFDSSIFNSMTSDEQYLGTRLVYNSHSFLTSFTLISIIYFFLDRDNAPLNYGLTTRGFDKKPYLMMLLIMAPIIFIASFGDDFLSMYPRLKPNNTYSCWGLNTIAITIIFETIYLLDFINVEIVMRGFMIIGLSKYLGKHAILPTTMIYMLLHFEKPVAETIGSILGGYLLSVIAFRTRSILGGFLVHMGVAAMMELFAYFQYWSK